RVPVEIAKLTQGETVVTEWLARRKDGSLFHCEIRAQQFANGQIQGFVRDITERKEASERFAQSQRARAILSGVDYAIVHTQNQKQLLAECCRVAVEKGGFKLAWIGMIAPDGTIQPVAKAGDTSYLRGFHAVVQDVPDGHGPVSRAIREKRPIIIEDMDRYDVLDPWRERARQFGMSYVAAFPIRIASRLAGSFQVYAPRAHFFDHDEVHLLTQVSDELSFALTAMDAAASRRHAEQELRKSERDLADFFASSPVGLLWVAANGCILRANQAELNLLGRDEKAVLGRPVGDFHADPEAITALLDRLAAGETVHDYHTRLRQKNGDIIHVLIDANGLWEKQRLVHSRWFIRDITRRVELEREVLNASDEERQRLGQDLHDDLCQQLTGIHFLSEALARSLKEKPDADAADAREITQLARNALNQAREMAHGLSPIQVDAEGLMEGLNTLAAYTRKVFRRECHFQCPAPVLIPDQTVALHLYRI
ncbi:MAG TPA: GAF domain-containing protein, partial [Candidatus Binatia bacterium]|nr:GAF domain-containing protein [Candidatus Binatia bacterium]